jgi:hypothetical protein
VVLPVLLVYPQLLVLPGFQVQLVRLVEVELMEPLVEAGQVELLG